MTSEARSDALVEAAEAMGRSGVMSPTGHLNFSARLDGDRMVMTSRGTLDQLSLQTLAVVGFDGHAEHGELDASTQAIVGMHAVVYRRRADVGAVVHTHSPHSTAFALAHRPLPCRYEALARRGQRGEVPVVPWAPRGSQAFLSGIGDALAAAPDTLALLLGNHGLLAFGSAPTAAVKLLMAVEEAAHAELLAAALGGARDMAAQSGGAGMPEDAHHH